MPAHCGQISDVVLTLKAYGKEMILIVFSLNPGGSDRFRGIFVDASTDQLLSGFLLATDHEDLRGDSLPAVLIRRDNDVDALFASLGHHFG